MFSAKLVYSHYVHQNLRDSLLKTQNVCFISSDTRHYVGLALLLLKRSCGSILVAASSKRQMVSINEKKKPKYCLQTRTTNILFVIQDLLKSLLSINVTLVYSTFANGLKCAFMVITTRVNRVNCTIEVYFSNVYLEKCLIF